MKEQVIEYVSAGRSFAGFLVEPDPPPSSTRPGILVLHGGRGLGEHERQRSRMLAELGYVAFAPDVFGEVFATRARGLEVIGGLVERTDALRARLADALAHLQAQPSVDASRTAVMGFCFGGLAALEVARSGADVRSVVSFHGSLSSRAPAQPGAVRASVLVCTGAADPFVTREHRTAFEEEMTRAKVDWQIHVYADATHAFTERGAKQPGAEYHEPSDRRSWAAMRALFDETLSFGAPAPKGHATR
jgi:dienelactone hydrolase